MDVEPWVIALGSFVVVSVIVIIVSMFSIRETPFEEAVANRHQVFDLAHDPSFSSKKGKDKNKNKERTSKKLKEVKTAKPAKNCSSEPNEEKVDEKKTADEKKAQTADEKKAPTAGVKKQTAVVETLPLSTPVSVPAIEVKLVPPTKNSKNDSKKHDHIEFKVANEVVTLNEEEDQKLSERRLSRDDRPRKPILIRKGNVEKEPLNDSNVVRGNSFETVHPKDEFELVMSKQSKQCELVDGHINGQGDDRVILSINTTNHIGKKQKIKLQSLSESTPILTSKQLIETVKNLPLTDEEVQLVVNELLNKQSEDGGESNWSSKNDPMTQLKKTLSEKEQALATESSNLQAAQARLRELRQEFAAEKTRNSTIQQTSERLRLEIQRQQLLIQQLTERHDVEIKALQTNLQSKLNDERSLAMAREENKRFKELIKKLEAERSNLESIPRLTHEIEQLRSERAQCDRTIASLKSSNEESQRHTALLDEHLQKLVSDRTQEESAREQQVKELRNQLQASESKVQSLLEELQTLQNSKSEDEGRKSQTDQRIKQMETQIQSLESENSVLKNSLSKREADASQRLTELTNLRQELENEIQTKLETITRLQTELEEERTSRFSSESQKDSRLKSLDEELNRITSENEQVVKTVTELKVQNELLNCEKGDAMDILRSLCIEGGDQNNLVSLVRCLADQPRAIGVDVAQLEKEKQILGEQVEKFKQTLSEKVSILLV